MASPRNAVDFSEIDSRNVTFLRKTTSTGAIDYLYSPTNPYPAARTTQYGFSVSMSSAKTVKVGASGDILVGRLVDSMNDGTCVVQDFGYMSLPYTAGATAPVVGRGVVCDGSGGVAIAASGSEWKERGTVVDQDTTALTVTVKLGG
jgi:hypothetical protein